MPAAVSTPATHRVALSARSARGSAQGVPRWQTVERGRCRTRRTPSPIMPAETAKNTGWKGESAVRSPIQAPSCQDRLQSVVTTDARGLFLMASATPHSGAIAIGELAQRTGCNIETIRYYERIGLLPVPERKARFRRYGKADVQLLAFVGRARELGFTLDKVHALLCLSVRNGDACGEVRAIAAAHLADVRAKIADLRAMEGALADAVRQCDAGSTPGCPLIDVLTSDVPLT